MCYFISFINCLLCSYDKGGHLFIPSYIMRTHGSKKQEHAVRNVPRKQMQKVFEVKLCSS